MNTLAHLGHAVAVGVAQQGDAVGAGHAGAGALHHLAHHHAADLLDRPLVAAPSGLGGLLLSATSTSPLGSV